MEESIFTLYISCIYVLAFAWIIFLNVEPSFQYKSVTKQGVLKSFKNWKFARFFRVQKSMFACLSCTQSLYIRVVFMNAHNLHFTLTMFFSCVLITFTKCYIIVHGIGAKLVSNWEQNMLLYITKASKCYVEKGYPC